MNYCTKCKSYYQRPGTCNCYAEPRPVVGPIQPTFAPYYPFQSPTVAPYGTFYPFVISTITVHPDPEGEGVRWHYTTAGVVQ